MYIWTLDSHDCYGIFSCSEAAREWADKRGLKSYQILLNPPHRDTLVLKPF